MILGQLRMGARQTKNATLGADVDDDDNDDDGDKDIDDDDGSTKELTRAGRLNRSGAKRYKKFTLNTNTGSIIENYKC